MEFDKELIIQISVKILVFIVILIISSIFCISEYQRSNSSVYKKSLELVRNNESIKKTLGDYIKRDWLMKGSPFPNKETGIIMFSYSIVGVKGRARVYVNAVQYEDKINTIQVSVKIGNGNSEIIIN